ncbi:Protein disulfide isomerase-like 1-1 [Salvia divinorum]|uniref:Protein disulfide isomerase-like 1-1 n=1 Tax=Salvia divinorum TaxID=28513 RepID=A0ABD1I4L7_SALDI
MDTSSIGITPSPPFSAASVTTEESESKEFVVALDYFNFTDFDAKHKFVIVEFYTPCPNLAPLLWELCPVYKIRSIRASAKSLEGNEEGEEEKAVSKSCKSKLNQIIS